MALPLSRTARDVLNDVGTPEAIIGSELPAPTTNTYNQGVTNAETSRILRELPDSGVLARRDWIMEGLTDGFRQDNGPALYQYSVLLRGEMNRRHL